LRFVIVDLRAAILLVVLMACEHCEKGVKVMKRLYRVFRLLLVLAISVGLSPMSRALEPPAPNTLEEAFAALDAQLPALERKKYMNSTEDDAVTSAHMGLGMWIRNEWFRHGGSALPGSLQARSLDDASAIVLTSYWRHLNARPLDVEGQVACYHRWWDEQQRLMAAAKPDSAGNLTYHTPSFSCPDK
jgi:hypothetical protein